MSNDSYAQLSQLAQKITGESGQLIPQMQTLETLMLLKKAYKGGAESDMIQRRIDETGRYLMIALKLLDDPVYTNRYGHDIEQAIAFAPVLANRNAMKQMDAWMDNINLPPARGLFGQALKSNVSLGGE